MLAGGAARRLGGADKPSLRVGGRPLLASVVAAARDAGARDLIVVGPARGLADVLFVAEDPPGAGPVPALRRGLAEVRGDWVAVLAADLPFLRAGQLTALLDAASGGGQVPGGGAAPGGPASGGGAVLVDDAGLPQWLVGCWRTSALASAIGSYSGNSLRGLFAPLGPALIRPRTPPGVPPPWLDCDTPADLRRARRLADGVRE